MVWTDTFTPLSAAIWPLICVKVRNSSALLRLVIHISSFFRDFQVEYFPRFHHFYKTQEHCSFPERSVWGIIVTELCWILWIVEFFMSLPVSSKFYFSFTIFVLRLGNFLRKSFFYYRKAFTCILNWIRKFYNSLASSSSVSLSGTILLILIKKFLKS